MLVLVSEIVKFLGSSTDSAEEPVFLPIPVEPRSVHCELQASFDFYRRRFCRDMGN
jgi:hypothetical protein